MKILCYPTSLNMGFIIDAFAILKRKNPNIRFSFLGSKIEKKNKLQLENNYYLKKSKINANFFYFDLNKKNIKIDKNYLNYFEKISDKNIWKYIFR